ncbi:hypothetical protein BD769DRAFT_1662881 [Suillus cothurnatus]|nr:hypothetical protein BD769DRAFT_1662881 [Suillus cothurnatus]
MAASRKVASKLTKSRDTQPAQPAQPPVCTTSGRQRWPIEKENYRACYPSPRKQGKEVRETEEKALKAAYQAEPDDFEQELSELHSDIDREEETMFSDRNMPSKLSQGPDIQCQENPPDVAQRQCHLQGYYHRLIHLCYYQAALTLSPCDDPDESTDCDSESQPEAQVDHTDEGDNNDITKELSPVAQGTKRPLDVTLNDAMVLPKIKKKIDGSHQRMKASDFDDISKEILVMATSIFRCLIVTQAPFPDNVAVETKLAKTAWHEACQIKGINIKLTPSGVKMLLTRTSQVRGELKMKMHSLTASFLVSGRAILTV